MSNVPAKFASALVLAAVAGMAWTALSQGAAHAGDSCLTKPNDDDTPQGKHWYYRIERGTGRHCWYLRGEDEKSAARADVSGAAPSDKPAPRKQDATTSRAIADAHAELPPQARATDDTNAAAPPVWPNPAAATGTPNNGAATANNNVAAAPADNATTSPLAARWPQPSGVASSPSPAPSASPAPETSLMLADAQPDDATADASPQPAAPPQQPAERNTGSIQKLVLVAFGALALAGLTGSAVYRLGRRRRRNDWLRDRANWQTAKSPQTPPWIVERPRAEPNLAPSNLALSNLASPDLDELDVEELDPPSLDELAAPHSDYSNPFEGDESDERVEKIEEFLARLTRQLQAELESTGRAEQETRAAS